MIIEQYDACDPHALKGFGGGRRAGYVDGECKWPAEGWSMFPGVPKVRISVLANDLADVYDWEKGTAPLSSVRAVVLFRSLVYLPSAVYCSQSSWPAAAAALEGLPVVWWVAGWSTKTWPVLEIAGKTIRAAAWQFASLPTYDVSRVDTTAWPVQGEPAP